MSLVVGMVPRREMSVGKGMVDWVWGRDRLGRRKEPECLSTTQPTLKVQGTRLLPHASTLLLLLLSYIMCWVLAWEGGD